VFLIVVFSAFPSPLMFGVLWQGTVDINLKLCRLIGTDPARSGRGEGGGSGVYGSGCDLCLCV
jgi:hypothetical protein